MIKRTREVVNKRWNERKKKWTNMQLKEQGNNERINKGMDERTKQLTRSREKIEKKINK